MAGKILEEIEKKIVQGRSWKGYCQFPALGHDLVLRSLHAGRQACKARALSARPDYFGPRSRPKFEVVTWLRLGLVGLGRDVNFMS